MKAHRYFMQKCIELARMAGERGNPPVGSVLELNGEVIGQGMESTRSSDDITEHAEVMAIKDAVAYGYKQDLQNATMYTTHEPCIMCSYAIRQYGIKEVVFGVAVDFIGGYSGEFKVLCTENVPKWGKKPSIISGVCKLECTRLSEDFRT